MFNFSGLRREVCLPRLRRGSAHGGTTSPPPRGGVGSSGSSSSGPGSSGGAGSRSDDMVFEPGLLPRAMALPAAASAAHYSAGESPLLAFTADPCHSPGSLRQDGPALLGPHRAGGRPHRGPVVVSPPRRFLHAELAAGFASPAGHGTSPPLDVGFSRAARPPPAPADFVPPQPPPQLPPGVAALPRRRPDTSLAAQRQAALSYLAAEEETAERHLAAAMEAEVVTSPRLRGRLRSRAARHVAVAGHQREADGGADDFWSVPDFEEEMGAASAAMQAFLMEGLTGAMQRSGARRHVWLPEDEDRWTYEDLLELDRNNVRRGVSAAELRRLERHIMQHSHAPVYCQICMSDSCAGEVLARLPCKHAYHDVCIKPWFGSHRTCPVCRAEIPES